jgi:hypothetical protein
MVLMWSIEDRTQKREDITELVYTNPSTHEEELRIHVRTSDANLIHNILNKKQILHDVLDSEYRRWRGLRIYQDYLEYIKNRYKEAVTESEKNGILL